MSTENAPVHTAFAIWSLEECLEGRHSAWLKSMTSSEGNELDELKLSPLCRNGSVVIGWMKPSEQFGSTQSRSQLTFN